MRNAGILAVVLLVSVAFLPCAQATDGPSDLALLLEEAFSHPDAPPLDTLIDFSYYKGVWAGLSNAFGTKIFFDGTWNTEDISISEFWGEPGGPVKGLTVFEDDCEPFGVQEMDLASLQGNSFDSRKTLRTHPFENSLPLWDRPPGRFVSVGKTYGLANESCVFAYAFAEQELVSREVIWKADKLAIVLPDVAFPGMIPLRDPEELGDGIQGVSAYVTLRNGTDGLLDEIMPLEEKITGIELTRNERGIIALMVASDKRMYLVEFEQAGTVFSAFPSQ